jgi:hypothetical protein
VYVVDDVVDGESKNVIPIGTSAELPTETNVKPVLVPKFVAPR